MTWASKQGVGCSGGGCTLQVMRRVHALGVDQILAVDDELRSVRMTDPGSTAQPT